MSGIESSAPDDGPANTVTSAIECAAPPSVVLSYLAEPANLPEWAPGFADAVRQGADGSWTVSKDGVEFPVRIDLGGAAGTVDFLREAAPGRWAGAYSRVTPQPRAGSVIAMTLPTQVGGTAAATAAILRTELAAIVSSVGDTGI
jgi:hypothetical protein